MNRRRRLQWKRFPHYGSVSGSRVDQALGFLVGCEFVPIRYSQKVEELRSIEHSIDDWRLPYLRKRRKASSTSKSSNL